MKIKELYLFTNRNTIAFDEKGEQIVDVQGVISWRPIQSYEDYKVEDALKLIIRDNPMIYIARWQEWRHEITLDEFCSLIGFGPWYWEYKQSLSTLEE